MKRYALIAASIVLLAGCQQRDREYGETTPQDRGTTTTQVTTNEVNRTDRTAVGTPGRTSETETQRANQTGNSSDQAITSSIQASFQTGIGNLSADMLKNIQVTSVNGMVTLKGNVSSESEKQQIENHVKQIPGVLSVNNQLQVSGEGARQTTQPQPQGQGQTPNP